MRSAFYYLVSLGAGIALAVLSGLYDVTPSGLVGAVWYGLPVPWLFRMIVAPQYYPWDADYVALFIDVVFWVAVVGVVLFVARRRWHH